MKKHFGRMVSVGALLWATGAIAVSEFRTPLELVRLCYPGCGSSYSNPYGQWSVSQQYIPGQAAPCSDPCQPAPNILFCCARPWAVGYCRFASEAFVDFDDTCEGGSRTTLSSLWFGKECFRAEEAFGGLLLSEDIGCPFNPFLIFSQICPKFDYSEKGVTLGVDLQCNMGGDACGVFGFRFGLPYKFIKIDVTSVDEEDLKDVIRDCSFEDFRCGVPVAVCDQAVDDGDFAYRLDFLSTITAYGSAGSPDPTQMGGINVGDADPALTPIYLTKRVDETFPPAVQVLGADPGVLGLGKVPGQIAGQLAIDGSGVNEDSYHFGAAGVDYFSNLGTDRDTQRTLFVVPQLLVNGMGQAELTPGAKLVKEQIVLLVESLLGKGLATEFLCRDCRITLKCDEKISGAGDLWTQVYTGLNTPSCCFYGLFGISFPTGREVKDPRRVYDVSTGNNGHFEVKFGAEGSIKMGMLGLWFDGSFNQVVKSTEKRAAPFEGSTIRNIGSPIDAEVEWNYWIARMDLAFLHPKCCGFGALFGYEFYSKSADCVSLCDLTARDCFGIERCLDASILEVETDRESHKVRGEIFYASNIFRTYFGASYVFSGRNVMSEVAAYLGVMATF